MHIYIHIDTCMYMYVSVRRRPRSLLFACMYTSFMHAHVCVYHLYTHTHVCVYICIISPSLFIFSLFLPPLTPARARSLSRSPECNLNAT